MEDSTRLTYACFQRRCINLADFRANSKLTGEEEGGSSEKCCCQAQEKPYKFASVASVAA
jgi:hypothetical protein